MTREPTPRRDTLGAVFSPTHPPTHSARRLEHCIGAQASASHTCGFHGRFMAPQGLRLADRRTENKKGGRGQPKRPIGKADVQTEKKPCRRGLRLEHREAGAGGQAYQSLCRHYAGTARSGRDCPVHKVQSSVNLRDVICHFGSAGKRFVAKPVLRNARRAKSRLGSKGLNVACWCKLGRDTKEPQSNGRVRSRTSATPMPTSTPTPTPTP